MLEVLIECWRISCVLKCAIMGRAVAVAAAGVHAYAGS